MVKVTVHETSENSRSFNNKIAGDLLYLDVESKTNVGSGGAGADTIKILDEEVLEINGENIVHRMNGPREYLAIGKKSVMVDRGEYMATSSSVLDTYQQRIFMENHNDNIGYLRMLGDERAWWENGFIEGQKFIDSIAVRNSQNHKDKKNAWEHAYDINNMDVSTGSMADLLAHSGHGRRGIICDEQNVSLWQDHIGVKSCAWRWGDIDVVLFNVCDFFVSPSNAPDTGRIQNWVKGGTYGGGIPYDPLFSLGIHALLATDGPIDLTNSMGNFETVA